MHRLLTCLSVLLLAAPAAAQTPAAPAPAAPVEAASELKARVQQLPAALRGEVAYDAFFSPAFRAQIPVEKFTALNTQISASGGKPVAIQSIAATTPLSAMVTVQYEQATVTMQITVDAAEPHYVTGLRITGLTAREASVDAVLDTLASLPGQTGFALARLDANGPVLLQSQTADRTMAIGSEFKLVILSELVRETAAGERGWDDTVTLDGAPLPGGGYSDKPAGTKVSLRELATQMISISDNSATDILLATLGRKKVEAMLPVVGIKDPKRMRPFLKTLDAFKLKAVSDQDMGKAWFAADEAGRRAMLDGDIAKAPISIVPPTLFFDHKPRNIDTIEWFASPLDMIRVMDWLRRHTEKGPAAEARAILAKNAGVGPTANGLWNYVGFKGGSEPGVIALTYLMQGKDGAWYAASASWNDPAKEVDNTRFAGLISRALELSAPH